MAQVAHPAGAIEVGICSRDCGLAHYARLAPIAWHGTQRHIVVFPGNRLQLSDQGKVRSKSRKRLNETGDSLSGSVENAIVALRIVEAITKSPIGLCAGPIRRAPGIWLRPSRKRGAVGVFVSNIQLGSCDKGSGSSQNLRCDLVQIALLQETQWNSISQLRIDTGQPCLNDPR